MADLKPIALWAVPRSLSTAFERVFVERDDLEVLHEPFSASYYYSEERLSDRYSDVEPQAQHTTAAATLWAGAPPKSAPPTAARWPATSTSPLIVGFPLVG
jgi:hypothetical protein